jgi:hypothetical protein
MNWILTTALCVILIEIAVRMPLATVSSEIRSVVQKALHTLAAKSVSDHWKEKVMLVYACSLFKSTMKLCGFLLTIGAVAALLMFAFDFFGVPIGTFIASWTGMLFSIVAATAYFTIRKVFA